MKNPVVLCLSKQPELGTLIRSNELGAEFRNDGSSSLPQVGPGTPVIIQFHTPEDSVHRRAQITGTRLVQGHWHYRMIWST